MIILTAIVVGLVSFAAVCIIIQRIQQSYGLRANVSRRLQKFKDDTAAAQEAAKPAAPRRAALTLADIPFLDRTFKPLLRSIQDQILSFAPTDISTMLERKLVLAGKRGVWSVNQCVIAWIASSVSGAVIALILVGGNELMLIQKLVVALLGAVVGAIIPFIAFNRLIDERHRLIRRQMPEFLDLLCVSVQAGLSFEGSMSKLTARMQGPLIDECKQMQRDGQMGIPRRMSLQQMAKRCDMEEIYLFTASVIQSERLGTSMSKTLTVQAANMRERHRQRVKEQALKAPVKIIFPLVIFILPALFVLLLLPIIYTTIQNIQL